MLHVINVVCIFSLSLGRNCISCVCVCVLERNERASERSSVCVCVCVTMFELVCDTGAMASHR